jgi:O-antigen/teichoic acid export membrane protein
LSVSASVSNKVVKNTFFNFVSMVCATGLAFFLTPYMLARLGKEMYGLYSLVGMFIGYAGMLEFSMDSTLVKFVAEHYAKKQFPRLNAVIGWGLLFYSVLAAVVAVAALLLTEPALNLLRIPHQLAHDARFIVTIGLCAYAIAAVLNVFGSVINGLQRMDILAGINTAVSVLTAAGTVFVLQRGFGVKGLILNFSAWQLSLGALYAVYAFRLLPQLAPSLVWSDFKTAKELFLFGLRLHVSRIAVKITTQTDRFFLTYFVGVGVLAYFQIGNALAMYAVTLMGLASNTLVPALTEVAAADDGHRLLAAYQRSLRFLTALAVPLFVFIGVAGGQFITAWVGLGYGPARVISAVLALGWLAAMSSEAGPAAAIAINKPQVISLGAFVAVVVNVSANFLLIRHFGLAGAAWGTALGLLLQALVVQICVQRALGLRLRDYLRSVSPFFGAGIVSAGLCAGVSAVALAFLKPESRRAALGLLAMQGAIFSAAYVVVVWKMRVFTREETDFIVEKILFFKQRLALGGV